MGRPKGSKTKPLLDPSNILESSKKVNDENENPLPSSPAPVKKAKLAMNIRKKSKTDQVWHSIVGPPLDFFPASKLPQNKAVLRRYLALREKFPKEKQFFLVNKLYDEIVNVTWVPARIPTVSEKLAKLRIRKVIDKFMGLKHHTFSGERECSDIVKEKIKDFLSQLCDLAPANLYDMLRKTARLNFEWESDWQFYLNMSHPRQVGCVAGEDVKLAGKEATKQDKEDAEAILAEQEAAQKRKRGAPVTGEEFDDGVNKGEDFFMILM